MVRDYSRALLAAAAALLLLPACEDGDGDGSGGALFSDDFNRSDVGAEWTSSSAGGTMAIDSDAGTSGGALTMSAARPGQELDAQTAMNFQARPVTFTLDLAAASQGAGVGGARIVDSAGQVVASAEQFAGVGGGFTFGIGDETLPFPSAGGTAFQTLSFSVDEQGNGAWLVDGAQAMTRSGVPNVPLSVSLYTRGEDIPPGSASFPTFAFDNVSVTTP
jgi:hypothetical protein